MHYLHFKMPVLHFKKHYFAAEMHYLHFKKSLFQKLQKVKYVKVASRRPADASIGATVPHEQK